MTDAQAEQFYYADTPGAAAAVTPHWVGVSTGLGMIPWIRGPLVTPGVTGPLGKVPEPRSEALDRVDLHTAWQPPSRSVFGTVRQNPSVFRDVMPAAPRRLGSTQNSRSYIYKRGENGCFSQ